MTTISTVLSALFLILLTLPATSQQLIVEERTVKNEESVALQSWTALLDQEQDYCMETYEKFIKEFFKTKVSKRGKTILVAERTAFPELTDLRLDQRAIFATQTGGTSVSFTFSPGYDLHFGKEMYAEEFRKCEQFVKNFVRYHYKEFYGEKIKSIQDKIDSNKKDIESNDKKIERNNKAIADNSKSGGDDAKSKAKTDKMRREIDAFNIESSTKRDEISSLESELEFNNISLRKVETFR